MSKRATAPSHSNFMAVVILGGLLSMGLGFYLYRSYGTLEPCGMLRAEVKIRVLDGRFETLGDIPSLIINNGDQLWCAKEFTRLHLP